MSILQKSSVLLCVFFLWGRGLNSKDIHDDMFPVYSGKCLSFKEQFSSRQLEEPLILNKSNRRFGYPVKTMIENYK
jgi:hypothetical protein